VRTPVAFVSSLRSLAVKLVVLLFLAVTIGLTRGTRQQIADRTERAPATPGLSRGRSLTLEKCWRSQLPAPGPF
jgi:hypothetical protein